MGQCVLCNILADVSAALWYSIIVDEATDVFYNEQMLLVDRSQLQHSGIHPRPHSTANTKAETIYLAIKDILIRTVLPINQCRGQACIWWCFKYEQHQQWSASSN